jgi:hypothetical protein
MNPASVCISSREGNDKSDSCGETLMQWFETYGVAIVCGIRGKPGLELYRGIGKKQLSGLTPRDRQRG